MKNKAQLTIPNFAGYFLLFGLVVLIYFLYVIYAPFATSLIFAGIFATIFYPLYKKILKLFVGHKRISSLITCLLTLFVIAIPLALFITLLVIEGISALNHISTRIAEGSFDNFIRWEPGFFLYDNFQFLSPYVENIGLKEFDLDLLGKVSQTATEWGTKLLEFLRGFFGNIVNFLLALIIFFFALYYFLKDGDMIMKRLTSLSPFPQRHEQAIFDKFKEVSLAMIFGIFFTAIIQGTLAGIGYAVVGIANPVFWAAATALFSIVPLFGTAIIWVPASIFLIIMGNYFGGIGLFLWGVLVVGTIDNFVKPYLIEGRAPVHPLLTFLSVLGGVFVFGLKGVILGPLVLNLLLAFLHIYEREYAKILNTK